MQDAAVAPSLLSTLFRGLADSARISCLLAVRDRARTVNEIVAATGIAQPSVSKHLACLRDCGLLRAERSGRYVSYSLSDTAVTDILDAAADLLARVGPAVEACPTYGARSNEIVPEDVFPCGMG